MFVITNPVIGSLGVGGKTGAPLTTLIATGLRLMFTTAGVIMIFFMITAGINWMTAEGKPDKIEKYRNQIINALTGLVIVAGTVAITSFIGNAFDIEFLKTLNFTVPEVAPLGTQGGTGSGGTGGGGTGGGGGGGNCTPSDTLYNDGGAGGYCPNGGAAWVKCNEDGHYSYPHYDFVSCVDSP